MQVRPLRVLQERQFEPLGAVRPEKADVRVLAVTNRDLAALAATGTFRQDLFYRINVMKLELPPLRRRREDIPLLVRYFIARFNAVQNKHISGVSPDVLGVLEAHDYPGNVRELQNIVEHAFVLIDEGRIDQLAALGIETLICGAISAPVEADLTARGVKVFAFPAGEADAAVDAFLSGRLTDLAWAMPGCCGRHRRRRARCRSRRSLAEENRDEPRNDHGDSDA